jgi:pyruvate formate lyase activating enzyme
VIAGPQPVEGNGGWIFNIQRFSVHDGPGIRTTVFLKGCPLRCAWCSNPESQSSLPHVVFWADRCIRCDGCLAVCPRGAVSVDSEGGRRVSGALCDLCGLCLAECYAGALEQIGRPATVDEVLAAVEEDRLFYEASGGGVTLSGGEPLAQPEFSARILRECRRIGVHTAMETCGYALWDAWEGLLPHLDLVLYDLKHTDPVRHERLTGVSNQLILDNLRRLDEAGIETVVRWPLVPGYNDDPETLRALAGLVQRLENVREIHLLPYHRFGRGKYERLGLEYPLPDLQPAGAPALATARAQLAGCGLEVKTGG